MKSIRRAAPLFVVKSLVKDRGGGVTNYGGVDAFLRVTGAVEDDVCGCAEAIPAAAGV